MPLYSVMIQMIINGTSVAEALQQTVESTLAWVLVDSILAVFLVQVCDPPEGDTVPFLFP